ncbi:MAG: TIGR03936 family radical SAM-associated protein, partial [Oscillospiraceae bacterium]
QESVCESCDFRLNEEMEEKDILLAIQGTLPQGIEITSASEPTYEAKDIRWAQYEITIFDNLEKVKSAIEGYEKSQTAIVTKTSKKSGEKQINLKELVKNLKISTTNLEEISFTALFPAGTQLNINPTLLLDFLQSNYEIKTLDANILRQQLFNENLEILT